MAKRIAVDGGIMPKGQWTAMAARLIIYSESVNDEDERIADQTCGRGIGSCCAIGFACAPVASANHYGAFALDRSAHFCALFPIWLTMKSEPSTR
jgi:hypothetical protein